LEVFLLERARHPFERSPALRVALQAFEVPSLSSVAEVNRLTGLSPKRLNALFRAEVGLSPKVFWRVRRFQGVLRGLERRRTSTAMLAAELGYCDQAHLNREFREVTGMSPRRYLAASRERPNHVALSG
jgi:AraC-like DNA-binding protein